MIGAGVLFGLGLGFIAIREICSRRTGGVCRYYPEALKKRLPPGPPGPPGPPPRKPLPPKKRKPSPKEKARMVPMTKTESDASVIAAVAADKNLREKGRNYNRAILRKFQKVAKPLVPDGIYGGRTAGALRYYLKRAPLPPFSAPRRIIPYAPPGKATRPPTKPKTTKPSGAKIHPLALGVEASLESKGRNYSRPMMRNFQRIAKIAVDGLYGGGTAGALGYFLGRKPPQPIFKPLRIKKYRPR